MGTDSDSAARLDELESRLAFQDDLIEELNRVVARQDGEMQRLLQRIRELENKLADLAGSAGLPDATPGHERPPHY